jgi:hypothetical protein
MFSRLIAGMLAIAFVAFVDRAEANRRKSIVSRLLAWFALLMSLGLAPLTTMAAERLADGTNVRMTSSYLEAGWYQGTLRRAPNKCWMVSLSKPASGGYTLLALKTASRLQIFSSKGQWQDASPAANLADQPRECMEDGAD